MPRLFTSRRSNQSILLLLYTTILYVVMPRSSSLQLLPRILQRTTSPRRSNLALAFARDFRHEDARAGPRYSSSEGVSVASAKHIDDAETVDTTRKRKQHVVRWETANEIVEFMAFDGETLRTAALRRGIVSPHNGRAQLINCRGLGTCGTCAVEIKSGNIPLERNTKEKLRLSFPPHGSKDQSQSLRLACQIQIASDLEVIKRSGFWGQDPQQLSSSNECTTYFGDLEFILDDKSPTLDDVDKRNRTSKTS